MPIQSSSTMSRNTSFAQELAEISRIRQERRAKVSVYPTLSVVIATVRPHDLENILKQMLKQSMPKFEIVLGLHDIDLNIDVSSYPHDIDDYNVEVDSITSL